MNSYLNRALSFAVAAIVAADFCSLPVYARGIDFGPNSDSTVSISNNSGGMIGQFALQAAVYRRDRKLVKVEGRCDSACTLFLGMPQSQLCVSPGSYFRFHAPVSPNPRAAHMAKLYMLKKYPSWVRSYIASRGGLTRNLVTMDYSVTRKHLPTCGGLRTAMR